MFQKRFYIIKKNSEFDVRSEHLLCSLGLEERFIDVSELVDVDVNRNINYEVVWRRLFALKRQSLDYLNSL